MKITGKVPDKPVKANTSRERRGDNEIVTLKCGDKIRVIDATVVKMLGDKLGAQIWCEYHADWFYMKKTEPYKSVVPDEPLF